MPPLAGAQSRRPAAAVNPEGISLAKCASPQGAAPAGPGRVDGQAAEAATLSRPPAGGRTCTSGGSGAQPEGRRATAAHPDASRTRSRRPDDNSRGNVRRPTRPSTSPALASTRGPFMEESVSLTDGRVEPVELAAADEGQTTPDHKQLVTAAA